MLDIKKIQKDIDNVINQLKHRKVSDKLLFELSLEINKRNKLLTKLSDVQFQRNSVTKEISLKKTNEGDKSSLLDKATIVKSKIFDLEKQILNIQVEIEDKLLFIPNLLHEIVPFGDSEKDNVVIEQKPHIGRGLVPARKTHYDIGVEKKYSWFSKGR